MHFGNKTIDLVVAGPNEGQNNGPFLYTISGTIGATYAAVERNVCYLIIDAGCINVPLPLDPRYCHFSWQWNAQRFPNSDQLYRRSC